MEAAWFPVVLLVVLLALVATALITATWMSVRRAPRPWFWRASAGMLWAGVLSWVLMFASDSTVGEDGVLHEPFALVPIGWFLLLAGTTVAFVTGLLSRRHRPGPSN
ncbi:MAG: hypothetical protein JWQ60_645 [Pseudonocardia sp.]|nr:hypothetical protein [Pseudonocardia sp.]